jgi:hypothetical protein
VPARRYLGFTLAAQWGVRALPLPPACSCVRLLVQPVCSEDGLVRRPLGECEGVAMDLHCSESSLSL